MQYARVAEANYKFWKGDDTAELGLLPALHFARRLGIAKLEVEALSIQSRIALGNGQTEVAARLALRTLSSAASLGMRLRVTAGLVQMGRVLAALQIWDAARSMLVAAIRLGSEQGYQLKVEEANRELIRMATRSAG